MADKPQPNDLSDLGARPLAPAAEDLSDLGARPLGAAEDLSDLGATPAQAGSEAAQGPDPLGRQAPWAAAFPVDANKQPIAGPVAPDVYRNYLQWKWDHLPWYEKAKVSIDDNVGGLTRSLYNAAVSTANSVLGSDAPSLPAFQRSEFFRNNIGLPLAAEIPISLAMSPLDPIGTITGNKLTKLAGKLPGVRSLFSTSDELAAAYQRAAYEVEAYGDITGAALKLARRNYLSQRMVAEGSRNAVQGGLYAGMNDAAEGFEKGHDFERTAHATLMGMGFGGVLGAALGRWAPDEAQLGRVAAGAVQEVEAGRVAKAAASEANVTGQLTGEIERVNRLLDAHLRDAFDAEARIQAGVSGSEVERAAALQKFEAANAEIAKLSEAKAQLLSEYKNFASKNTRISKDPTFRADTVTRAEYVDNAFRFAEEQTQDALKRKVISEADAPTYHAELFDRVLDSRGQKPDLKAFSGSKVQDIALSLTNGTELMSRLDRLYGTQAGPLFHKMLAAKSRLYGEWLGRLEKVVPHIEALRKRGMSDDDITLALNYIDRDGKLSVDGLATKTHTRDPFPAERLGADLLERFPELQQIRAFLTAFRDEQVAKGAAIGEVTTGYVHLMPKAGRAQKALESTAPLNATKEALTPKGFRERQGGRFNPAEHETDPTRWISKYLYEAIQQEQMAPTLDGFSTELQKVAMLSAERHGGPTQVTAIDSMLRIFAEGLGLKNVNELRVKLADRFVKENQKLLELAKNYAGDASEHDDWLRTISNVQYKALVLNPKNIISQYLQPVLVGTAEIGNFNVANGYRAILTNAHGVRGVIKELGPVLRNAELDDLQRLKVIPATKNPLLRAAGRTLDVVSTPLTWLWGKGETLNRYSTFAGAYLQFKGAAEKGPDAMKTVLYGLLTGQKQAVMNAYREGGAEAAARTYGVIRNARVNFVFDNLDKPQFFKGAVTSHIPFTTWSTNQLARWASDIGGAVRGDAGAGSQLTARYVYPTVALAAFAAATGVRIPGANPVDTLPGAGQINAMIPIAGAATQALQSGKVDPLLKFIPGVMMREKAAKARREGTPKWAAALGLQADRRTGGQLLMPDTATRFIEKGNQNEQAIKRAFGSK